MRTIYWVAALGITAFGLAYANTELGPKPLTTEVAATPEVKFIEHYYDKVLSIEHSRGYCGLMYGDAYQFTAMHEGKRYKGVYCNSVKEDQDMGEGRIRLGGRHTLITMPREHNRM